MTVLHVVEGGRPDFAVKAAVGYSVDELRRVAFPERPALLSHGQDAIIRAGDISEIYGLRGTGKSLFAESIGLVVATGRAVLSWHAPEPQGVLIIDGEMPSNAIRSRTLALAQALDIKPADARRLVIVARDWQEDHLPRLDTVDGQAAIAPHITDETKLVIVDNCSTLFDPESEKDPSAWSGAQEWLLGLRRRGIASLLIHHASRAGNARGHSRREDIMDVIVKLTRPDGYHQDQGARFKVEFDKARGFYGSAAESFIAKLGGDGWTVEADEPRRDERLDRIRRDVVAYLEANPGATARRVSENVTGRAEVVRRVVEDMAEQGVLLKRKGGFHVA